MRMLTCVASLCQPLVQAGLLPYLVEYARRLQARARVAAAMEELACPSSLTNVVLAFSRYEEKYNFEIAIYRALLSISFYRLRSILEIDVRIFFRKQLLVWLLVNCTKHDFV